MDLIPGAWVTSGQGRTGCAGRPGQRAQPPLPLVGQLKVQASCPFVLGMLLPETAGGLKSWKFSHLLTQPLLYLGEIETRGRDLPRVTD